MTTIGHGARPLDELVECLLEGEVRTLIDVRRYPGSRRNPQFNQARLAAAVGESGIDYRHAVALGGRLEAVAGEQRFACLRRPAFRTYAARMATDEWRTALAEALTSPAPCFMCAETQWRQCHRSLIADLLAARGHAVVHLIRPRVQEAHVRAREADYRGGRLFLCGHLVA